MKTSRKYSEQLVQRVNELFHDLEHDRYQEDHPEIIKQEGQYWLNNAKPLIESAKSPKTVVDIGTGTGFVPLIMGSLLSSSDKFICTDISQGMLDEAKKNIEEKHFSCQFEYQKIEPKVPLSLPLADRVADIVTMNSVLHHIHDTATILKEIDRVLKPAGLIIIAHEPNALFKRNILLQLNYALTSILFNFKDTVYNLSRKIGLEPILEKIYLLLDKKYKKRREEKILLTKTINEALLKEKLIDKPLKRKQIYQITDIQVDKGFTPQQLLPSYELVALRTSNHMLWVSIKHFDNKFISAYDRLLGKLFSNSGATFFSVYRKNRDSLD